MSDEQYHIRVTAAARDDLFRLYDYLATAASAEIADKVITQIEERIDGLRLFPRRGAVPKELILQPLGEYRQLVMEPYRIFYKIVPGTVIVALVADGRQDIAALLNTRLLDRRPLDAASAPPTE